MRRGRPLIAIVGRPNVGKSTLFNRLIRSRRAIVEDMPGVTRDRHYADCELNNVPVTLVDTGGFVPDNKESPLARYIRQQAQAAVEECDVVLFVVDARTGPTSEDQGVANFLRKSSKPVLLLVNKTDGRRDAEEMIADFHRFGLGRPFAVSAEHNEGMIEVLEALIPKLPETDAVPRGGARRAARRRSAHSRGHRGAAQRGQVDPGQRAAGRGAGDRQPHRRHHPRPHRLASSTSRAASSSSPTPPASAASPPSPSASRASRCWAPCAPPKTPTWWC